MAEKLLIKDILPIRTAPDSILPVRLEFQPFPIVILSHGQGTQHTFSHALHSFSFTQAFSHRNL